MERRPRKPEQPILTARRHDAGSSSPASSWRRDARRASRAPSTTEGDGLARTMGLTTFAIANLFFSFTARDDAALGVQPRHVQRPDLRGHVADVGGGDHLRDRAAASSSASSTPSRADRQPVADLHRRGGWRSSSSRRSGSSCCAAGRPSRSPHRPPRPTARLRRPSDGPGQRGGRSSVDLRRHVRQRWQAVDGARSVEGAEGAPGSTAGTDRAEHFADAVYGTILVLAVVAALSEDDHAPAGAILGAALATSLVFWIVHVYAEVLSRRASGDGTAWCPRSAGRTAGVAARGGGVPAVGAARARRGGASRALHRDHAVAHRRSRRSRGLGIFRRARDAPVTRQVARQCAGRLPGSGR